MIELLTDMLEQARRRGATVGRRLRRRGSVVLDAGSARPGRHGDPLARAAPVASRLRRELGGGGLDVRSVEGVARPARRRGGVAGADHRARRALGPARILGARAVRCRSSTCTTPLATTSPPRTRSSWPGAARRRRSPWTRASRTPRAGTTATGARATPTRPATASRAATRRRRFSLSVSPVASANGEMQRDSWYHVTRKRARLDAPEEIGRIAARRALRRLGARAREDGRGAGHLRRRHGGVARAPHRRRGVRPGPLSPGVLPARQARRADRRAVRHDRGRRDDPGRARVQAVRRRGPADSAHGRRRQGRAALLPARHLQRPEARHAVDPSRGARRERRQRVDDQPLHGRRRVRPRRTSSAA